MYLTIAWSDTSSSKSYAPQLGKVAFAILALLGLTFVYDSYKKQQNLKGDISQNLATNSDVEVYSNQINLLKKENKSYDRQIKVYSQELAILQARLDKFDNIAKKLLDDDRFADSINQDYIGSVDTDGLYDDDFSILSFERKMFDTKEISKNVKYSMDSILELLGQAEKLNLETSFDWPVINERTFISSKYGWRTDPFTGNKRWHSGIDIAAGWNAPIVAASDGVIIHSGYRYGYGISIEIQHKNGLSTRYAHLKKAIIKKGDIVKKDQLIALMGSSGRSTGPHLHFEVLINGKKTDPTPYVKHDRLNAKRKAREGLLRKAIEKS
jgi:murein DD-endopeptidase MepM/ murein hydrolase activator NlpD